MCKLNINWIYFGQSLLINIQINIMIHSFSFNDIIRKIIWKTTLIGRCVTRSIRIPVMDWEIFSTSLSPKLYAHNSLHLYRCRTYCDSSCERSRTAASPKERANGNANHGRGEGKNDRWRARNDKGEEESKRKRGRRKWEVEKRQSRCERALSHVADRTTWAFRLRHRPTDRSTDRPTDQPVERTNERTDIPSSVLIEGGHGRFHSDVSFTCTCTPCRAHVWYTFPAIYMPSRRCARCTYDKRGTGYPPLSPFRPFLLFLRYCDYRVDYV